MFCQELARSNIFLSSGHLIYFNFSFFNFFIFFCRFILESNNGGKTCRHETSHSRHARRSLTFPASKNINQANAVQCYAWLLVVVHGKKNNDTTIANAEEVALSDHLSHPHRHHHHHHRHDKQEHNRSHRLQLHVVSLANVHFLSQSYESDITHVHSTG